MIKTVFAIPKMDCLAEESLVRMALEQAEGISRLDFDLPIVTASTQYHIRRKLEVIIRSGE